MIVVDIQAAQSRSSGHRGIGRYTRELAAALVERHHGLVDAFCWNPRLPTDERITDIVPADLLVTMDDLAGERIDVLHVASPFEALPLRWMMPRALIRGLVVTCFDLIPMRFSDVYHHGHAAGVYFARVGMLQSCDAILTDSQSAADDCVELLGIPADRLTVIGGGVNDCFVRPTTPLASRLEALRRTIPGLRAGYVLVPTGMDWRKNTEGAIAAYALLPEAVQRRHQLVINSKVTRDERLWIQRHVDDLGAIGEVVVPGFVADDELALLYQSAELVCFPSKYEGFGLPVLEARRCGARVICSNASSLPEVMPLAAATFNPHSVEDIATVLERALTDVDFAAELDAAPDPPFDFAHAADRTAGVYRQVAGKVGARRGRAARRLAVMTLLPPASSGVADHSAALLPELDQLAEVTCFVEDDVFPAHTPARPYPVERLARFPTLVRAGQFDAVLYCIGNNALHTPFLDVIDELPGHVLFHDVRLSHCYSTTRKQALVARYYRDTGGTPLYAAAVANRAVGCLVQSAHAADLLLADTGVKATNVGPHPMSPAVPVVVDGDQQVHIVSLGIASVVKQTAKFVSAAEQLLATHPQWRADVVGEGGAKFVDDASPLTAVGYVDDAEFAEWLGRTTVLVQLRETTNGESSGVVAHALARGVPTIVTDLGAQSELPDDAVVKVPRTITADELAATIEALVLDVERRQAMSEAARRYAAANTYRHQAERIIAALFDV